MQQNDRMLTVSRVVDIEYTELFGGYRTAETCLPCRELLYIDYGCVTVTGEHYQGDLLAKQLLIYRPHEKHSLCCPPNEPANLVVIRFECDGVLLDDFAKRPLSLPDDLQMLLSDILRWSREEEVLPAARQLLQNAVEMLLLRLLRQEDGQHPAPAEAASTDNVGRYLQQHFRSNVRLDELCTLFNTNKTSLCNNFRRRHGCTITAYVNELKIEEAKRLLRQGELSVSQISQQLSFSSVHYFSRMFKHYTGLSPMNYVNTLKAKLDVN